MTRADVCAVACAELFRGAGEILASPMGLLPSLGARLARLTFEPDLLISDGEALLLASDLSTVEGWLPYHRIFDVVAHGSRHVVMGADQIDRHGNQNISCIGRHDRPARQLLGFRGAPGNTVNHRTSYWIPKHGRRTFVPAVDVVSGVGHDRARSHGTSTGRYHDVYRVVTNLAVLDFDTATTPCGWCRCIPVWSRTMSLPGPVFPCTPTMSAPPARPPTRRPGCPTHSTRRASASARCRLRCRRRCHCEHARHRPHPAGGCAASGGTDRNGLGRRAPAGGGHRRGGRSGHPGIGDHDLPRARRGDSRDARAHPGSLRVNLRADAVDAVERIELLIREGVRVASFAMAPKRDMIARLKDAGIVVIPSVGASRHAEKVAAWGADAVIVQGGEAGGHTGGVATTLLLPSVVDTVDIPVIAAGGFFDGRGLAAALAYGAAGVAMGTRFLLTRESTVPDAVKRAYLARGLTDTVVTRRVDGWPHRVLRTELVDRLERAGTTRGLLHAVRNAARFRGLTGLSWSAMVREGRSMRRGNGLSWAQVIMAANAPMLLRSGLVDGRTDTGVFAAGQVVGLLNDLPSCQEVIIGAVEQAREIIERLGRL